MTATDDLRQLVTELRALYAASTAGEWYPVQEPNGWRDNIFIGGMDNHRGISDLDYPTAAFIAAAHNAMPRLLDAVENLLAVDTEDEYKAWVKQTLKGDDE